MFRKGNTCALLVGMYIGTATMENSVEGSQKIKVKTTYDPVIYEAQAGIKIAARNINNLRYTDDTTLMAES